MWPSGTGRDAPDKGEEILAVYTDHVREIFAYCLRRLASTHLAEDSTSAVFLRLVQEYDTIRTRGRQRIRYWLYGAASNVVAQYLRDIRRQREIATELTRLKHTENRAVVRKGNSLDWPTLYEAIGKLKQKQQDIVVLRYFQELTTAEIAAALGINHVTVRVNLSRAIKKLEKELGVAFGT